MPVDGVNGKVTNVELEMIVDDLKNKLPYLIQNTAVVAQVMKAKYDNLVSVGFTEKQALEIVKSRPLYE